MLGHMLNGNFYIVLSSIHTSKSVNFFEHSINLIGSVGAYVCLKVIKVSVDVHLCPFSTSRSIWFYLFTVPNLRVNG